ncbi:MmcB family DNA repair protein [Acidimangrovimonas sediminis]|uniref:MmcB family DNA repair protein n=1 Tax=Acidimangrovimonas sediminis TaxID=2056283 RepID=UPI000C7FD77A|nr:MmcB family DNA repair protein [Acidimangrovimonas sediminis]
MFASNPSDSSSAPPGGLQPGQVLARGVCRALLSHDFVPLPEMVPAQGLRVDVMAVGPKGEIWVVECKSSRADFTSDRKWQGYLAHCDRFFWAVDAAFPQDLLPPESGLILADGYGAEILRMPEALHLPAARRKVVMRAFARQAARQLQGLRDPVGPFGG